LWIAGVIFSLVRGNFVGDPAGNAFIPDFPALLTVFLVISSGPRTAAVFAFSQGLVVDLYSAGLMGLFTGFYLVIFCVALLSCGFFDIHHAKGQFIITSLAVAIGKAFFFIIVNLVMPDSIFHWPWTWQAASTAVVTGLLSPVIISVLQVMRRHYIPEWTNGFETEFDEVGALPRLWRPWKKAGEVSASEDSIKREKL
jgi:rod shape-determining protein MreD